MGNISITNEKSINDLRIEHESINQFSTQIIKYNSTQTGSHSGGISSKSAKNRNKNSIPENKKNCNRSLRNSCKHEINTKIFRFIFPPPEKNSFYLRKSCRETTNLRLSKETKMHFHTNITPKNHSYFDVIDDSLLCDEYDKNFLNNTINNKEVDYEIDEDYFSFIRNKIEEANDEILDYRRFSRRSFDLEKLKINNKNLKMKNEDGKVCEETKISGNLENNSLSQAVTKPNTINEECDSIKNETIIETKDSSKRIINKEINIHQSSKSLISSQISNNQNAIVSQDENKEVTNTSNVNCANKPYSLESNNSASTNYLYKNQTNISSSEDEEPEQQKDMNYITKNLKEDSSNNRENNTNSNYINNNPYNEFELNYIKSSEALRRSYLAKLIYTNIWQPTKKQKDHNSLIIFDWDDTLLCTSFLTPNGIFLENMRLDRHENEKLKQLDTLAYKILSLSAQKADTYIITNAEPGWVEYSAERFYPKVFSMLDKVKIVSARGEFEKKHPNNSRQWKIQTFLKMVNEFDTDLITNFICLGDSVIEMEAAHIFASKFSQAFIKTVKFKESPSLDELIKELTLVTDQFLMIFSAVKNLTIRVERKSRK